MNYAERGVVFSCAGEDLVGVLALPERALDLGVLIVVGGPQYRVGSHRQFVLLARQLAAAGFPVLRFDYRGMGDSTGEEPGFQEVDQDIAAAIDRFQRECPAVQRIVLWGLCDAASAILLYCARRPDPRLSGLVLLNPWVRSEASYARTQVKHYYGQRLFQLDFWKKALQGKLRIGASLHELLRALRRAGARSAEPAVSFQLRMRQGLAAFPGRVLLVLSGRDLTAREFVDYARSSGMAAQMAERPGLRQVDMPEADHTFSSADWRGELAEATLAFLAELKSHAIAL